MSKLNERLTLVANLSVVVGIVFLAVEMRQNTAAIQAQIRDSITEKQMELAGWRATSPELAAALSKVGELGLAGLSGPERQQLRGHVIGQLRAVSSAGVCASTSAMTSTSVRPRSSASGVRITRWRST